MAKKLKDLMGFFEPLRKDRGSNYGDFSEDMALVSIIMDQLQEWYFKCNPEAQRLPRWWAAVFMVVIKLCRVCTGRRCEDNALDGSHYLGQAVTMQQEESDE